MSQEIERFSEYLATVEKEVTSVESWGLSSRFFRILEILAYQTSTSTEWKELLNPNSVFKSS